MKKLIALMMCAMLLLSGCAAVTAEGPGVGFRISDPVFSAGGSVTDLTGLAATVEAAEIGTGSGLRLTISAEGQEPADVILGAVGQYLYLSLPGAQGANHYAFDLDKALQAVADAYQTIAGAIAGIIPAIFTGEDDPVAEPSAAWSESEMTDEELEAVIAELEAAIAEMEAAEGDDYAPEAEDGEDFASVPVMTEADGAIEAKINEIMDRCMTAEIQQIDGEDFQVIGLDITEDDMAELLDAASAAESTGISLGQYLAASGAGISLSGTVTGNQDFSKFNIDGTLNVNVEGEAAGVKVVADDMDGDSVIAATLGLLSAGQPVASVALNLGATVAENADWLPAELPADTVVLTDLSVNGAGDALEEGFDDFGTLLMNMLSAMVQAG